MAEKWTIDHQDPTERLIRGHWTAGYLVYFTTSEGDSGQVFVASGDSYVDNVKTVLDREADNLSAARNL